MFNKFIVNLILVLSVTIIESNIISVTTKNGIINGIRKTFDGKEFDRFLSIPYAEPPIGDLRFKRPVSAKKWSKPIDASKWPNPCHQHKDFGALFFHNKNFSEDCLYLNIWSPVSNPTIKSKAVLFWIHGGAFQFGSSAERYTGGEVLSTRGDVVVVTINYRVSTLGFLYTGTDDAVGNMGLWDQALALEWINKNIDKFGGDPNRITIFGESAGSWAVSLHLLSPITRNLFKNAIMMSGSAINKQAGEEAEAVKKKWLNAAKLFGCKDKDKNSKNNFTPKLIECLKNMSAESLITLPLLFEKANGIIGWMTVVVVDGEFLPKKPLTMLKNGDYKKNTNLMIGTVEDEGSFLLQFHVDPNKYELFKPYNLTYKEAFNELKTISSRLRSRIPINGSDVAKFYFSGLSESHDFDLLRRTIGIAVGDFITTCPTIEFAKTFYSRDIENSDVYQYYFNSKLGLEKYLCSKWMGACHATDIFPVFGVSFREFEGHLDREREISAQMIDFFTNFAKTGLPSPQHGVDWPKYYTVNGNIIAPYYEITNKLKPPTNFAYGLKLHECDYLWKTYIDNQ